MGGPVINNNGAMMSMNDGDGTGFGNANFAPNNGQGMGMQGQGRGMQSQGMGMQSQGMGMQGQGMGMQSQGMGTGMPQQGSMQEMVSIGPDQPIAPPSDAQVDNM